MRPALAHTARLRAVATTLALVWVGTAAALEPGQTVDDFSVTDSQGGSHSLSKYKGKVVVLVAWSSACKTCKRDGSKLQALSRKYSGQAVFLGLAPNRGEDASAIEAGKKAGGISFPVAVDAGGAACKKLGAATTPTVYVLDGSRTLRYVGAVDNNDRRRTVPYLQNAIDAVLAGSAPSPPKAQGVGRQIQY